MNIVLKKAIVKDWFDIVDLGIDKFTESAIAASGNNSLTERQKAALNKFFKELGALDNSGVWMKLKKVYLPCLAAEINKACVNYKTNKNDFPSINAEYWDLRSKGLIAKKDIASPDYSIKLSDSENTDIFNFSCFAFNTEDFGIYENGHETFVYSNYMKEGNSDDNYFVRLSIGLAGVDGILQSMTIAGNSNSIGSKYIYTSSFNYSTDKGKGLRGISINREKVKALFCNNVSELQPIETSDTDKLSQDVLNRGKMYLLSNVNGFVENAQRNRPFGMIMFGEYLEDAEMLLLRKETKELYDSLVES